MPWELAVTANAVVWLAYLSIAITILQALWRSGQLRTNRLGLATGLIFLTCAGGHGEHMLHLLVDAPSRAFYDWHLVLVDIATAGVGIWYWTLRSSYGAVLDGPALFADLRAKQRQALEINDNIVQGLTVARYAFEEGDDETGMEALDRTLASARGLISELLASTTGDSVRPGDLVRSARVELEPGA